MDFSLTTLGTASALPTVNRYPSAHVLNVHGRLFLIDCGEACQIQLRRYNIPFNKIEEIFISHIHGDHVFGIFGLLSTFSMLGRTKELRIFAPEGFGEILGFYMRVFGEGVKYNIAHIVLNAKEPTLIHETKSVRVYAFRLNHRIDTYGFLFREKTPPRNIYKDKIEEVALTRYEIARLKEGEDIIRRDGSVLESDKYTYQPYISRSFAYCCDTAPFAALSEYVKGVDMLYLEATFMEDMSEMAHDTYHSTAAQSARCALDAGVERLIIGHFSSRYKSVTPLLAQAKEIFPETYFAQEGIKFEVPITK